MKKKLRLALAVFLCLFIAPAILQAQYNLPENRVWTFGYKGGVSFAGSNPVSISSNIVQGEGCASVCNSDGQLLFYSDGAKVWDADGGLMPNGQNLDIPAMTAFTTTQAALIVPVTGNADQYYLFTLGTKLFCYRIDMTLNGGQGDVDLSFPLTHMALRDSLTEKMIAIPGCDNNVWVLVKSMNTGHFLAYNITSQGVNTTPVVSSAGFSGPAEYFSRTMSLSPNGHKIAINANNKLELLNFDITTGKVSNGKIMDNVPAYGVCFSPNGRYLYTNAGNVHQYDLQACDPAATKVNIGGAFFGDIRLAPNGKIYFRSAQLAVPTTYTYLGSIEHPDIGGTGCQFRDSITATGMPVTDPSSSANFSLGFPNTVVRATTEKGPMDRAYFDTCVCVFPFSTGLDLTAEAGFLNYQWSNGAATATNTIRKRGIYWVSYQTSCGRRTDTFNVRGMTDTVTLTYNTPQLQTSGTYTSYKWYKDGTLIGGAAGASYTPLTSGMYSVLVTNSQGCTDSAYLQVTIGSTGIGTPGAGTGIIVYPNPATDVVYIESSSRLTATVTDLSGHTLMAAKRARAVDISTLKPGIYFLRLSNEEGRVIAVKKVTKVLQ